MSFRKCSQKRTVRVKWGVNLGSLGAGCRDHGECMKLDISESHKRNLNWGDTSPNELKNIWVANLILYKKSGIISFIKP